MEYKSMKCVLLLLFLVVVVKCEVSYSDILKYRNVTIVDTETLCSNFEGADVSEKCWEQLDIVCNNSTLFFTLFDASSKFPYPGLAFSTRSDYGNYDQCMTVDHSYSGGRILGEFCAIGLVVPDILGNMSDFSAAFRLSVCRPNGCSASDYNAIVQHMISLPEETPGFFLDQSCSTIESHSTFTAGDITVLSIFGIIFLLMIVSTLYDMYLYQYGRKSINPLCLAFSVLSNGRKLLHVSEHTTSKEQIEVFHGMRVISMMWIVAGHGMGTWVYAPVTNVGAVSSWTPQLSSFHMTAAPLSVDTFFFMSGFLLAFQYLKGNTRTLFQQVKSVPIMIVHRYLRLTPAVLMLFLMIITFYMHMGDGPMFGTSAGNARDVCRTYWWRLFLYIQNYFEPMEICMPQTWYLAADMQMFLISPLVLIPVSLQLRNYGFKGAIWGLLVLNVIFTALPMILKLCIREYQNSYDTQSRLITYFIGVMLGTFMRSKIDKPFLYVIPKSYRYVTNAIIWALMVLGMLAVTICYQDQQINHEFESRTVFESLMRPAWAIGLSWITYACYHGRGGFINWILCRPIFQVLGRLTYCIYLVHMTVITYSMSTMRAKWYFTQYNTFHQFMGHYFVSVLVAMLWTLAFESPLIIIEKYLLGGSKLNAKEVSPSKLSNTEEGTNTAVEKREV